MNFSNMLRLHCRVKFKMKSHFKKFSRFEVSNAKILTFFVFNFFLIYVILLIVCMNKNLHLLGISLL